jgi:PAS domain S-box-containing protein
MLFERYADIKVLATDPVIASRSSTPKQIKERLIKYMYEYKIYASLSFFDLNRIRIADTTVKDIGKQHPFTEYWPDVAEGKEVVMGVSESKTLKEVVFYFASVVKDKNGSPFGVVVSRIPFEILHSITKQAAGIHQNGEGLKIDLVDKNGLLLYSNYTEKGVLTDISPDWESTKEFLSTGKKIGSERHYHLGEEEISTFVREQGYMDFKGNDWTLIMHIPTKVVFTPATELRNRIIIVLSVIGAFAFFIIYLFSRTISKPIKTLRNAAIEIGKGNLDVKVEIQSKDEIGQLAKSFNNMATNLRKYISQNELILDSAGEGILGLDLNGNHTFVNPSAARILGYKVEELIGKPSHSIWHHTKKDGSPYPEEECPIHTAYKDGTICYRVRDEVFWRKDSTNFPVGYTSTPIIEDGKIVGSVVTFLDITEHKQAEEALRQSEEKHRALIETTDTGYLILDAQGRVIDANKEYIRLTGYDALEEILGRGVVEWTAPHDLERNAAEVKRCVEQGYVRNLEIDYVNRSGQITPIEINATVLGSGDSARILSLCRDITERKRAEELLRQSEEKYRTLFEESKDVVFISTPEGRFFDINPAGVELFGYSSKEELLQIDIARDLYFNPLDRNFKLKALIENGFIKDFALEFKRKDGQKITVLETSTVLHDEKGDIVAYRGIIRDVTEQKLLEQQLLQAQKMEAIGQLSGGIAHDFNNILTAIIGYGNLLQMKMNENDPLRHNVNQILASSERAAGLVRRLLAFSRKQIIDLKPVHLNEIVKKVEKLLLSVIGEDIDFQTILTDEDLTIMADSGQIEHVLMNLATNARDAMPEGGLLTIETDLVEMDNEYLKIHGYGKPGMYAFITVTDTGEGMDEKTREKIFEPFFTTKEVGKGTGLGLAMAYGIVKQHNGYINVYSELGKGTTFKIYLPVIKAGVEEAKPAADASPKRGTEVVLVAEDEPDVRKLTKTVLEEFGYTVIEAVNGEDAINKFMENRDKIQLLLLDVIMPKKNGKEVYEEIKKIKPDMKALFISGYTSNFIHKKGILEEGINFVLKPISPTKLLKKMREILDK